MKTIALILFLLPLPAFALDQGDATKGGGGAVAATIAALVARRKLHHARHAKNITREADRWGWDAARQARELGAMKARHSMKAKLRRRRR